MDYLAFIDIYHDRISAFHVKDAEFRPDGRQGVYSGYSPRWNGRAFPAALATGRWIFRPFTRLTQHGYRGWAVMEMGVLPEIPGAGCRRGRAFLSPVI